MKRSVLVLLSLLAATAATIVAGWVLLPVWAKSRLAAAGLGDVDFGVDRFSLGELSVSDVRFGINQEQRLERITVLFRPIGLLSDRALDRVLIEGADLHLVSQDNGIPRLAGVSLPIENGDRDDLAIPAIPAEAIVLRDSRVRLETRRGALDVPLSGALTQADRGAWTLDTRMVLRYREAHADLSLKGRLERNGAAKLQAALSNAEGWLSDRPEAQGKGEVSLERDRIGRLSGMGRVELDLAESPVIFDVQANRAPFKGSALSFALSMTAPDLDMAPLSSLTGLGAELEGHASLQARLQGALPIRSRPLWGEATASGRISVQVVDGGLVGSVADSSTRIGADLSLSGTSIEVTPIAPWELTGHLVGPGSPASFALSDAEGKGLALTLSTDFSRGDVAGAVDFLLEHPSLRQISGTVAGRAQSALAQPLQFELNRLHVDPTTWIFDGLQIDSAGLDAELSGTTSRLEGPVSGKLHVAGTYSGDKRISGGEVSLDGRLLYEDGTLTFEVRDCVPVRAKQLDLGGIRSLHPVELCARQPRGKPFLHRDPSGISSLELTLPSQTLSLAIGRGPGPLELTGTSPEASLSAVLDPAGGLRIARLDARGGRLELAQPAVSVSDIELSLVQDEATSVTLNRAVASSLSAPADFPVLDLEGKAAGRLDGAMKFELVARGRGAPLNLSLKGEQDFALAIGEMSYELDEIRFSPGGTQPVDISPAVGKLIGNARGSLGLSGRLSWVAGVPVGYSRLALRNLGFDAPGLRVRGIDTSLERAGRNVRNKLASQEVRVDLLDMGVSLRKGLIRFNARKAPSIRMEKIRFAWGGGTLKAKPFDLRLDRLSAEHSVVLELEGIQLSDILELTQIDALGGTGTLSGEVPLRIRGSEIGVDHGSISADGPGVLRYRPDDKPAFFERSSQTEMLFNALQDFRYDSLSIGLNGQSRDDLQLRISLAGSNPDLYAGHPFKLNFNISGELDTIVRRSLSIATFAERLGELISRYRR